MSVSQIRQTLARSTQHIVLPQNDSCIICSLSKKRNQFFAQCQHLGNCMSCAQSHMLHSLSEQKFPTCLVGEGCKARMRTDSNSIFKYFAASSKEQWEKFRQKYELMRVKNQVFTSIRRPCQIRDCPGIITQNRCSKCLKFYCEKCGDLDHDMNIGCRMSGIILPDGIKLQYCSKCNQPFTKTQGCNHIICGNKNCRFQFCEVCGDTWNLSHHLCKGVRQSGHSTATADTISQPLVKKSSGCCQTF